MSSPEYMYLEESAKQLFEATGALKNYGQKKYPENPIEYLQKFNIFSIFRFGLTHPDTLFLAMPISWKGTLQQYAGRLHRLFKTKKEVRIYDYVDIQIKMLERMYQKRLNGYASMGYKAKSEETMDAPLDIIFDKDNFLTVFNQDIVAAKKEILIVSPFVRKRRTHQMIQYLKISTGKNIRVIVVTRPKEDFMAKDHAALEGILNLLTSNGINIVFKTNIHQKFAIMDQKIVWYGSINLLSYGSAQESIMRIEGSNIANELMKSIESA